MRGGIDDIRLEMLARVTAAFAAEIDAHEPEADLPWPLWPDVAALIDHHLWAAAIVGGGDRVDRSTIAAAPRDPLLDDRHHRGNAGVLDAPDALRDHQAPHRHPRVGRRHDGGHLRARARRVVSDVAGQGEAPVVVAASAGHLALAVWERADPLDGSGDFRIEGDPAVVAAFRATPIHP